MFEVLFFTPVEDASRTHGDSDMLPIQTSNLPYEQQQRVHPDFLENEQDYLRMRAGLLAQYRNQWVAIQGGKVLEAGPRLMDVLDRTSGVGGHPYIALVGAEDA